MDDKQICLNCGNDTFTIEIIDGGSWYDGDEIVSIRCSKCGEVYNNILKSVFFKEKHFNR